jgi:hypothetical protein
VRLDGQLDGGKGRGMRGQQPEAMYCEAGERNRRWEMVPTGGPHLSASEREREGEAGLLDARWAARLKLAAGALAG